MLFTKTATTTVALALAYAAAFASCEISIDTQAEVEVKGNGDASISVDVNVSLQFCQKYKKLLTETQFKQPKQSKPKEKEVQTWTVEKTDAYKKQFKTDWCGFVQTLNGSAALAINEAFSLDIFCETCNQNILNHAGNAFFSFASTTRNSYDFTAFSVYLQGYRGSLTSCKSVSERHVELTPQETKDIHEMQSDCGSNQEDCIGGIITRSNFFCRGSPSGRYSISVSKEDINQDTFMQLEKKNILKKDKIVISESKQAVEFCAATSKTVKITTECITEVTTVLSSHNQKSDLQQHSYKSCKSLEYETLVWCKPKLLSRQISVQDSVLLAATRIESTSFKSDTDKIKSQTRNSSRSNSAFSALAAAATLVCLISFSMLMDI